MAHPPGEMKLQIGKFKSALSAFAASKDNFRILSTISSQSAPQPPKTLYVLDSSFNPPTLAHLRIATSALARDDGESPRRLLLLLATQNADKAPKPASFEQRLTMMCMFADDLSRNASDSDAGGAPVVDIGVTKLPYFADKAQAIDVSGLYPSETTQVHLTGYDTLIRILNPKYYPPEHTLKPVEPFLSRHRLRVSYRTGDEWGGRQDQDKYLRELSSGNREGEGGKREWAARIELVDGQQDGDAVVSSTKVRDACKRGDQELLGKLVTSSVGDWVLQEKLYKDE